MPSRPLRSNPSAHYFDGEPTAASAPSTVTLTLPDLTAELTVDRGVFSIERVDPGTKYLLLDAPAPPADARHVLDLGCGYGPIAITLAHRAAAASVWAVDVNRRAVDLCRANASARGFEDRVRASVVDAEHPYGSVPDDVRFDLIWSNPPIRIGKATLHELLTRWLNRLTAAGHAILVVQKHLGSDSLQRWLVEQGWSVARLGSRAGYRLLDVSQHDAADGPA